MAQDLSDPVCRDLILSEALAHVPGAAGGMQVEPIVHPAGSRFNLSFRVQTGAGRFVLRLSPMADAWLSPDRAMERRLHAVAAMAGIAPAIIHADPRDRWLITPFVAGSLWGDAEFADPGSLARLGVVLGRLHALSPPAEAHRDLLAVLSAYGRRLQSCGAITPATLAALLWEAQRRWQLSGAAGRPAAILHHDLNASNIIDSHAGLLLLDWECAAVGDPLQDVACVLSYYDAARPHAAVLLHACGLGGISTVQLEAAVWLFDLHVWLWYRERRSRFAAHAAELAAEELLWQRLRPG